MLQTSIDNGNQNHQIYCYHVWFRQYKKYSQFLRFKPNWFSFSNYIDNANCLINFNKLSSCGFRWSEGFTDFGQRMNIAINAEILPAFWIRCQLAASCQKFSIIHSILFLCNSKSLRDLFDFYVKNTSNSKINYTYSNTISKLAGSE